MLESQIGLIRHATFVPSQKIFNFSVLTPLPKFHGDRASIQDFCGLEDHHQKVETMHISRQSYFIRIHLFIVLNFVLHLCNYDGVGDFLVEGSFNVRRVFSVVLVANLAQLHLLLVVLRVVANLLVVDFSGDFAQDLKHEDCQQGCELTITFLNLAIQHDEFVDEPAVVQRIYCLLETQSPWQSTLLRFSYHVATVHSLLHFHAVHAWAYYVYMRVHSHHIVAPLLQRPIAERRHKIVRNIYFLVQTCVDDFVAGVRVLIWHSFLRAKF